MKKVLAILLTAAMLLGSFAISSAAFQEVTPEATHTNKVWINDADNAYFYIEAIPGASAPAKLSFDFRLDADSSETRSYLGTDPIVKKDGTVGLGTATLNYAGGFATGTWYHIEYATVEGGTKVSINGTEVGTITAAIPAAICGGAILLAYDNFVVEENGAVIYSEDFEDGDFDDYDGNGAIQEVTVVDAPVKNENVVGYNNKYWINDADNAYFYIEAIPGASAPSKLAFDFRLDADNSETRSYLGTDPIVKKDGTVGLGGATLSYAGGFTVGTWYNVEYATVEGGTQVSIDGEVVGTITAAIPAAICGGAILIAYDNFVVEEGGAVIYSEDFEDGDFADYDGNGAIATRFVETGRYDLGLKYWINDGDNAYFYIEAIPGASAPAKLSFDFRLDADSSETRSYLGTDPIVKKDGTVGLGTATLNYAGGFATGTWYHIEYATVEGGTQVSVDGAIVGTITAAIPAAVCGGAILISFDNYTVEEGGAVIYSEDFEDSDFDDYDGNGAVADHDLGLEPPADPIINIDTSCAPEGEASLIELSALNENGNSGAAFFYYGADSSVANGGSFIMNFDLALVDNDLAYDNQDISWLEFWFQTPNSDSYNRRFRIGSTFTGRDNDITLFDWGEATATNFHDVTIWNDVATRTGKIYIDGVLTYEGSAGKLGNNNMLFALYKASAIIDNYKIYSIDDYSVLEDGFPAADIESNGLGFNGVTDITIGGDCVANGHIYDHTTRTTQPTCYSLGEDTYYCAVCAEAYAAADVAMIAHDWEHYNINRIDDSGLCYNYCMRCADAGITERKYTVVPAAADYTGTLIAFYDLSSDFTSIVDVFDDETFSYANGALTSVDSTNYKLLNDLFTDIRNDGSDTVINPDNYSLTWDFRYDQNSANEDPGSYGHTVYWFMSDALNKQAFVGYDADNKQIYCKPASSGAFVPFTAAYELIPGEFYNIKTSFVTDDDNGAMEITVYVNGEEVLATPDSEDLYYGCAYNQETTDVEVMGLRIFGIDFTAKNFAIGDADFAWANRTYAGDVDGDYALTAADALLMRKYLAKVIDETGLVSSRLDANGDDAVNARDQLVIRKALVA